MIQSNVFFLEVGFPQIDHLNLQLILVMTLLVLLKPIHSIV